MSQGITRELWTRHEVIRDRYRAEAEGYRQVIKAIVKTIEARLRESGVGGLARGRVKDFDAFFRKLLERGAEGGTIEDPFVFITDLLGIRVITPFEEDTAVIADLLRGCFRLTEVDDKGALLSPREFGYVSTHLLIAIPPELLEAHGPLSVREVEIQLRTTLQDAWAEVEHELVYKAGLDVVDAKIKRKLSALNATLTLADTIFQEIRDYQKQRRRTLVSEHQDLMDKVSTIPEKMGRIWRGEEPISAGDTADRLERGGVPEHLDPDEIDEALLSKWVLKALQAHLDADLDGAVELYSQVLAAQPTYAIYNHRGIAYFTMSAYEKAIDDFTLAIEMAPEQARAYTNRGMAYRMSERLDEALADFNRSLEIDPLWVDSLYGRALTYFDLGNIPAALTDCDRAIALKPDFKQVLRFKRFVQDQ